MYSFKKSKSFLPLVIIPLLLLLNNCSDSSEYGTQSDYIKLGADDTTAPTVSAVSPTDNSTSVAVNSTVALTFSEKNFNQHN